jgi:hypothetical protein
MRWFLRNTKLATITLVVLVVTLVSGVAWAANNSTISKQAQVSEEFAPSTQLYPIPVPVSESGALLAEFNVVGAGFQPNAFAFLEIVQPETVKDGKVIPGVNTRLGAARVNNTGAFVKRVRVDDIPPEIKLKPGAYTILVQSLKGAQKVKTSAPLILVSEK